MLDGHLVLINLQGLLWFFLFFTVLQHLSFVLDHHQHCQLGYLGLEPDDLLDLQTVVECLELILLDVPTLAELEDLLLEH